METDLASLSLEFTTNGLPETMDSLDLIYDKAQKINREFKTGAATGFNHRISRTRALDASTALQDLLGVGERVSNQLGNILGDAFEGFLIEGKTANTLLSEIENKLLRMGNQYFTGKSSNSSPFDVFTGLGALAGNALTSFFPGFAQGGSFTVGGAAGKDRNLVGMRLTRGERVTIETPAQQNASASGGTPAANIHMNFNIQTPNAESFRRSQSQIQTEAFRNAQRLQKRNG